MRVLVTGGSGYIGSCAVRHLAAAGHEVVILDNLSGGYAELVRGYELVVGDIADRKLVDGLLKRVDAVMHFAAFINVGESVKNPRKYYENNVEKGLALLDVVLASKVRTFVFSSTCAVFGVPHALPMTEDLPREPINPYGASKLFIERVLESYSVAHGLKYAALRYFNAAGAHASGETGEMHDPETHLIPLALRAALGTGPALKVFGDDFDTPDGTCVRDYIHVSDLADAHVKAIEYLNAGGEPVALNLGTGKGSSIKELIALTEEVSGRKLPHEYVGRREGDPPALYAAAEKAERVLGWKAKRDLREILRSALEWELKKSSVVGK
jgi:UDP-glucose-4-epimerase GalE